MSIHHDPDRSLPLAICLHASSSSSRQWQPLADRLGDAFAMLAPDLIGHAAGPAWTGNPMEIFVADVARVIRLAAAARRRVHLVGHSYGGAVALRAATLAPGRFASVTVYEPVLFRVLRDWSPRSREAAEIIDLAAALRRDLRSDAAATAARRFVDYWSGGERYGAMTASRQLSIAMRMPAVSAHFSALWNDRAGLADYARVRTPLVVLMGGRTRTPARRIVELLHQALPLATFETLDAMGHLGPLTHAEAVAERLAAALFLRERIGAADAALAA